MKPKAFTLVELLVVIAIIGLLSTVVLITTKGLKDRAIETRKINNRRQAKIYCTANPGYTILKAPNAQGEEKDYRVYCDNRGNMWSETLDTIMNTQYYGEYTLNVIPGAGYSGNQGFYWSYPGNIDIIADYKINDCNEIPIDQLHNFPACNACATLNYAGFAEGWRLPSQRIDSYNIKTTSSTSCGNGCGRPDGANVWCASDRQLWDFGYENCDNWDTVSCSESQGQCLPSWDRKKIASAYWSSTQSSIGNTWIVGFANASVGGNDKSSYAFYVRCFLGEWP